MRCCSHTRFTIRQRAAILRLYVRQQLSGLITASRLRLNPARVYQFLHEQGVVRLRGQLRRKLGPSEQKQLENELLTTPDAVLARRYGLSRERVRQIRQRLGYPSSQIIRGEWILRARAERRERRKLERQRANELRQQQHRANQLPAVNRLSKRWRSGVTMRELAKECGVNYHCLSARIRDWRKLYPEKFPRRFRNMTPAWRRGVERLWSQFWRTRLPEVNRLSKQWKSGATMRQLGREHGISRGLMHDRIKRLRKRYPEKFPYRFSPESPSVPGAVVMQES